MKKCINCHSALPNAAGNTKYCRECAKIISKKKSHEAYERQKAILEYSREINRKSTMDDLRNIANKAASCGMSYGNYRAKGGS